MTFDGKGSQCVPAVSENRRFLPGRDEQGTGCEEEQPYVCAGGRLPETSRNVINKGLTEEDILRGSHDAFLGGWNRVKLYFMLGLPTETK